MARKNFITILFITLGAFSVFFAYNSFALIQNDFITVIENTEQCLTNCYATIKLTNPLPVPITLTDANFKFDFSSPVKNFELYRLENVTRQEIEYTRACNPYVQQNGSVVENCSVTQYTSSLIKEEFVPFGANGKILPANSSWVIRIQAQKGVKENIKWGLKFNNVYLDPWWNTSFAYRRNITITDTSGKESSGYPITISLNTTNFNYSKVRSDGFDIRFTWYNASTDNETEIAFNRSSWNNTGESNFTVNVTLIPASGTARIVLYYGNSTASDASREVYSYSRDTNTIVGTRFNEGTGEAKDYSGNGFNLSLLDGAAWNQSGKYGSYTYRNPSTSNLAARAEYAAYSSQLAPDSSFSVEAWVYVEEFGAGNYNEVVASIEGTGWSGWMLYTHACCPEAGNSRVLYFSLGDGTTLQAARVQPYTLNLNQWYHILGSYDKNTRNASIYVNGQFLNSTILSANYKPPSSGEWRRLAVGDHANQPSDSYKLVGNIDEFRYSSAVRTNFVPVYPERTYTIGAEHEFIAGEDNGRSAIEQGIRNALGASATILSDQNLYLVNLTGQKFGKFDKFVANGTKRWYFNYVTTGEGFTNMQSLSNNVYIWENQSLSQAQVTSQVELLINATK